MNKWAYRLMYWIIPIVVIVVTTVLLTACNESQYKKDLEVEGRIAQFYKTHKAVDVVRMELEKYIEKQYYRPEIPLQKKLQRALYDICIDYKVPYNEALAVLSVENPGYNPNAINHNTNGTIDVGLFQINEVNHKWLREALGITNFKGPKQSIKAGVFMLSNLGKAYEGHKKFMAYNFGKGGMKKAVSRGFSSSGYSRKVMRIVNQFKGE